MKKITLSVAALAIAMMSYGQTEILHENYQVPMVDLVNDLLEQNFKIDQVIDAIRMDMYYGHLENSRGMFYVNQMIEIKRDNEINVVILTRLENE